MFGHSLDTLFWRFESDSFAVETELPQKRGHKLLVPAEDLVHGRIHLKCCCSCSCSMLPRAKIAKQAASLNFQSCWGKPETISAPRACRASLQVHVGNLNDAVHIQKVASSSAGAATHFPEAEEELRTAVQHGATLCKHRGATFCQLQSDHSALISSGQTYPQVYLEAAPTCLGGGWPTRLPPHSYILHRTKQDKGRTAQNSWHRHTWLDTAEATTPFCLCNAKVIFMTFWVRRLFTCIRPTWVHEQQNGAQIPCKAVSHSATLKSNTCFKHCKSMI